MVMKEVLDKDVKRVKAEEALPLVRAGKEVYWKLKGKKGDHWSLLRKQHLAASWSLTDFNSDVTAVIFAVAKGETHGTK